MSNEKRFYWFKFYPLKWIDVFSMTDEQAGERFKKALKRLMENDSPEGTPEFEMIKESAQYSERQKKRIDEYWKRKNEEKGRIALPKSRQEVIDFALDSGLDVDDAVQWAEINLKERKGHDKDGNKIMNWKAACSAYCGTMAKKRRSKGK